MAHAFKSAGALETPSHRAAARFSVSAYDARKHRDPAAAFRTTRSSRRRGELVLGKTKTASVAGGICPNFRAVRPMHSPGLLPSRGLRCHIPVPDHMHGAYALHACYQRVNLEHPLTHFRDRLVNGFRRRHARKHIRYFSPATVFRRLKVSVTAEARSSAGSIYRTRTCLCRSGCTRSAAVYL